MRTLLISGIAAGLAGIALPASAESAAAPALQVMGKGFSGSAGHHGGMKNGAHRWGGRSQGRWHAGARAPGGWVAYRRPVRGFALPRYWVQPGFYIANYGVYGLPAPQAGYGWSRYYDDAVLTDRYGRVYDSRSDIDWGRYEGGYADDDGDYADDSVTANNDYSGRWSGTWHGDDGRIYSGDYDGSYRGTQRGAYRPGVDYDAPPPGHSMDGRDDGAPVRSWSQGGYIANGYYYPGQTVTTITIQPAVTHYVEEVVYSTPRKARHKAGKRKPRCAC